MGIEKKLWSISKESHGLATQWSICFMSETLSKAVPMSSDPNLHFILHSFIEAIKEIPEYGPQQ